MKRCCCTGTLLAILSLVALVTRAADAPTNSYHAHYAVTRPAVTSDIQIKQQDLDTPALDDRPEGDWSGQIVHLMAVGAGKRPRATPGNSREITKSFETAFHLARLRHPGIDRFPIELDAANDNPTGDAHAGTAYCLLLLAAAGDFELNPHVAITGDVSLDAKLQPVELLAPRLHAAAQHHDSLLVVPAADTSALDDAFLLRGITGISEVQVFSAATLDDAIALTRADADPKLTQAITDFASLTKQGQMPKAGDLQKILVLAPNHLSAQYLLAVQQGKKPTHLTPLTSVIEALNATGPMRSCITAYNQRSEFATNAILATTKRNLARVRSLADPSTAPVFTAITDFCSTYAAWATADRSNDAGTSLRLANEIGDRCRKDVRAAIAQVLNDSATTDRLMRR